MFGVSDKVLESVYSVLIQRYNTLTGRTIHLALEQTNKEAFVLEMEKRSVKDEDSYTVDYLFKMLPKAFDCEDSRNLWGLMEWFYSQLPIKIVDCKLEDIIRDIKNVSDTTGLDSSYFDGLGFDIIQSRYKSVYDEAVRCARSDKREELSALNFSTYQDIYDGVLHKEDVIELTDAYLLLADKYILAAGSIRTTDGCYIPVVSCARRAIELSLKACICVTNDRLKLQTEGVMQTANLHSLVSFVRNCIIDTLRAKKYPEGQQCILLEKYDGMFDVICNIVGFEANHGGEDPINNPYMGYSLAEDSYDFAKNMISLARDVQKFCDIFIDWYRGKVYLW